MADSTTSGPTSTDAVLATEGLSPSTRAKTALALDVDDLVSANRLARQLAPWFGVVKIGLELYTAAGPDAIGSMVDQGYDVFLDLKLHDIPTTVGKACVGRGCAGRQLPDHARPGRERHVAGRCRGIQGGRAQSRPARADRARHHGAHQRHRGARPHRAEPPAPGRRSRLRGHRVCCVRSPRHPGDGPTGQAGRSGDPSRRRRAPRSAKGRDAS